MIAAAAFLLLFQADPSAAPQPQGSPRFEQCLSQIEANPGAAYEGAMAWANETRALEAYQCAALALIDMGRPEQAARRLESLAMAAEGQAQSVQISLFSQAGHAWILANEPSRARSAFTRVVASLSATSPQLPDALIDRAIAYGEEGDHRLAEEDLSRALDLRPNDALALRLRALSRMRQSAFDLALADAEAALQIDPANVETALALGHVRESRRIGRPVEEDGGEPEPEN
ncbi:MAG: tetratricopeptide repeat protein [Alphaproteobacteria bacterium]|nr:tetratricopeptide repeat protein [Alphaproteobacteria bacterium]